MNNVSFYNWWGALEVIHNEKLHIVGFSILDKWCFAFKFGFFKV